MGAYFKFNNYSYFSLPTVKIISITKERSMEDNNDHNLEINPSTEIRFKGPFTQVVTSRLQLRNVGNRKLCYKVKTTAPKMYCVRPNSGLIDIGKQIDISIMLQPFDYSASDTKFRHKFLIQSVVADEENNLENNYEQVWKTVDKEMIREIKLKCSFDQEQNAGDLIKEDEIVASKNVSNNAQPGLSMTVDELKKQLADLKNENEKLKTTELRLRKIALQDTLDNPVLPAGGSSEDSKHSLSNNILLILVLCFIFFFIGILVAKLSS